MGTIQQKWQDEQIPAEDGIFFSSDEFIPLDGAADTGYTVGRRQPLVTLVPSWAKVYETVRVSDESRDLRVHVGETPWEGSGFVAAIVASTGQLRWLFQLSASEAFVKVETDGVLVRAVSGGYPMRYQWSIPIHESEKFTVESSREA